ncbi:MAG: hypothetical protein DRQ40_10090 [Gammaproteobacteria bacterium]|nr:MAG: hypothetical protein DRQ40_10090 [Gammaproteobacteria bacterium]
MLRVVNGNGGGTGGSDSPILMDKVPTHTHTSSAAPIGNHKHSVGQVVGTGMASGTDRVSADNTNSYSGEAGGHTHDITVNSNVGGSNWTPKYIDVIACRRV